VLKSEEITKINTSALLPWRWAESMRSCSLFWIPARLGEMPESQREWLLEFFNRLSHRLTEESDLHGEVFMEMQVIDEDKALRKAFLNSIMKESPILGRSWRPRGKQPTPANDQEVELLANKKKKFNAYEYAPEQAWWFLGSGEGALRERYLGYGGLTMFFLKRNPQEDAVVIPSMASTPLILPRFLREEPGLKRLLEDFDPLKPSQLPGIVSNHRAMRQTFSVFDVDKIQKKNESLMSPFRDSSKEVFGAAMEHNLEFEALPFILPRLASQDFFAQNEMQLRGWFEVSDVYINESREDEGIIMACKDNRMPLVASIANEMRQKGYRYWEG
jgi:hypothetical protein